MCGSQKNIPRSSSSTRTRHWGGRQAGRLLGWARLLHGWHGGLRCAPFSRLQRVLGRCHCHRRRRRHLPLRLAAPASLAVLQFISRAYIVGVLYCFIRVLFQSIRCQVGVVCVLIAHTVSHTSLPPLPSPKIRAASPCPLFFDPPTRLGCVRSLIIIPQPPAAIIPYLFVNLPPRICLASFFFPFRRLFLSLLVSPSPASRLPSKPPAGSAPRTAARLDAPFQLSTRHFLVSAEIKS